MLVKSTQSVSAPLSVQQPKFGITECLSLHIWVFHMAEDFPLGISKPWDKAWGRGQSGLAQQTLAIPADEEHLFSPGDSSLKDTVCWLPASRSHHSSEFLLSLAILSRSTSAQPEWDNPWALGHGVTVDGSFCGLPACLQADREWKESPWH